MGVCECVCVIGEVIVDFFSACTGWMDESVWQGEGWICQCANRTELKENVCACV